MRSRLIVLVLVLSMAVALGFSENSLSSSAVGGNALTAVTAGNNAFAFDLYSVLAKERGRGNLFFSPYSISVALAMTYAGARGETARQMAKTLHFDLAGDKLHPGFAEQMKWFNASGKSYQLAVANALWGQAGTEFNPDFLKITKKYYDSGFKEVDYIHQTEQSRQTINRWVEARTNNKIVELIKPKVIDALTRLVLTNAIYFKGRWESRFQERETREAPFYPAALETVKVPLMRQFGKFKYAEADNWQLLEAPYKGGEIVMDIILPKPNSDINKLGAALRPETVDAWLAGLSARQVEVFLPKFKVEQDLSLGEYLKGLGMTDAFDENRANFSGISKTFLYITKVIHKAFVEVNEEGTEAAAATAVIVGIKSVSAKQPPIFKADHPFFFLIRDLRSGSILFMGRMNNPNS